MNKGTMRGIAPKAEVVTPTAIPNNAARLIIYGHSYAAPYLGPYGFSGSTFDEASGGLDGARFPALFANLIGIDMSRRYVTLSFPAGAANGASVNFYTFVPEEGILEAIYYVPNTGMTGANTNTRAHKLFIQQDAAVKEVFSYVYIAGTALAGGQTLRMLDISNAYSNSLEGYRITSGAASAFSTNTCAMNANGPWSSIVGVGWNEAFIWQSTLVGTGGGLADPGGTIVLRWGGTYRNLAVGGSKLCRSGIYHGGWAAAFHYRPVRHTYGPEVVATGGSNTAGATTFNFDALEYPIPSGWKILMSNGVTVTTTANALVNATSVACSALSGTIAAGHIGTARSVTTYGYQSLTPFGLTLMTWGRNDGIITTPDRVAWRESYRATIANASCPYFQCSNSSNVQAVAGNGASASWTTGNAAIPAGQFITAFKNTATTIKRFTGAVGGTPPTLTIQVPPAFEGGAVDLFFAAQAGTSKGGAATITVDGGNPPTGACTINTSGVCTTENLITGISATISGTTTATITAGTNFSAGLVPELGMAIKGTAGTGSIAKGTKVSAITSTTVGTLDTAGTNGTVTAIELAGYIPMVKRLVNLTAGTHTILITLTAMDATDQSAEFIFLGYGIEAKTPATTPILVSGIARAPADTADWDDMLNFNTDTQNVINGTAPAPSGNSVEPAFPDSVVYCDTDSVLQGNISTSLFGPDGVHPNADGHNAIARAYYQKAAESFSADELLAR